MDKKTLLGLFIIGVILFGFSWYTNRQQAQLQREKARIDSINRANAPKIDTTRATVAADTVAPSADSVAVDSLHIASKGQQQQEYLGNALYQASQGTEQFYAIENDRMKINFSNKGGRVASVELKGYKTYSGHPLMLFDNASSVFDLSFFIQRNQREAEIQTSNYYFTPVLPKSLEWTNGEKTKQVVMRLSVDSAAAIEYVYTIHRDAYMVDFDIRMPQMERVMQPTQGDLRIRWQNVGPQNEKGFTNENNYTTIAYNFPGDDGIEELGMSKETKEETINSKLRGVAFKQQFFSSVFIAKNDFQNGSIKYSTFTEGSGKIKQFEAQLSIPYTPQTTQYSMSFYFGPNKFSVLKEYKDLHLQRLVPLGGWIIGWINRWVVIPTFDFLGSYIANFGLIILLLTIFIKIIISPLTYKSYLSTAKMRLLKPEIDKLNEKFPKQEDALKKQQAMMALYKSAGVNPMGGCIPMLIQFPILIAMFRFFPASIELRGESFLWADDLSSYDSILHLPFNIPFYGDHVSLFALLMALSVYVSSRINYSQTASMGPQMGGMKFMMLYLMPLMLLFWFNNYSSGLSYYYLVSNIITIGQTYAFRYIVNEDKLHQRMKENAVRPRKKSKFQQRYEDMMRQREQQLKRK